MNYKDIIDHINTTYQLNRGDLDGIIINVTNNNIVDIVLSVASKAIRVQQPPFSYKDNATQLIGCSYLLWGYGQLPIIIIQDVCTPNEKYESYAVKSATATPDAINLTMTECGSTPTKIHCWKATL